MYSSIRRAGCTPCFQAWYPKVLRREWQLMCSSWPAYSAASLMMRNAWERERWSSDFLPFGNGFYRQVILFEFFQLFFAFNRVCCTHDDSPLCWVMSSGLHYYTIPDCNATLFIQLLHRKKDPAEISFCRMGPAGRCGIRGSWEYTGGMIC